MKKSFFLPLILIVLSLTTACTERRKKPQQKVIKVNGDPLVFVKGTYQDGTSGISAEYFDKDKEYLRDLWGFQREVFSEDVTYDDIVADQAPDEDPDVDKLQEFEKFTFSSDPKTSSTFMLESERITSPYLPVFEKRKGRYFLVDLKSKGKSFKDEGLSVRVLHYSENLEERSFSVLTHITGPNNFSFLLALYFMEVYTPTLIEKLDVYYNYLFGQGVVVRWDQNKDVIVSGCATSIEPLDELVEKAVDAWQEPLEGRLNLKYERKAQCPPFSDLNSQNFQYIDDWIEILGDAAVLGQTSFPANLSRSRMVDADIFILKGEVKEVLQIVGRSDMNLDEDWTYYSNPKLKEMFYGTAEHEIGHLLGLHHAPAGSGATMSYDEGSSMNSYDKGAIQALYPKF